MPVAAAAVPALVAAPASAGGDMFFSKSSGTTVSTTWLEAGKIPDVAGNWHFGDLFVEATSRGRARAFGTVFDVTCRDERRGALQPRRRPRVRRAAARRRRRTRPASCREPSRTGSSPTVRRSDGPAVLRLRDGRVLRLAAGSNTGTLPARRQPRQESARRRRNSAEHPPIWRSTPCACAA